MFSDLDVFSLESLKTSYNNTEMIQKEMYVSGTDESK